MRCFSSRKLKTNLLPPGLRKKELRILAVGDTVRERSGDILLNGEVGVWAPGRGLNVRRVKRENMPRLGSHWKYRLPATQPSFLP